VKQGEGKETVLRKGGGRKEEGGGNKKGLTTPCQSCLSQIRNALGTVVHNIIWPDRSRDIKKKEERRGKNSEREKRE